ncbi:putative Zinc-regulated transporter 2 [Glarea lozoyensis 74030]|uniref:Putative Zinc-regulated transporter 2 n=1 Tax=Glarea lozoyensis (strain ATCC 74030 / MF5533) TaxID=1104152 RepID=H0ELI0_GLAL7|nr:putative Zinc-regulated transporter 2 [Glarea lozoyensis 74030]
MDAVRTVEVECDSGNDYDGRMGLRISAIFVIGLGSMLGALLPVAAARTKRMRVPKLAFFITKHFGSGVIITTAFIHRDHMTEDDHFAAQMTGLFILEFGVIFHSIFIGLTLAVAGEEFITLYIVLVFHQTFEGLGLGSRLATASWPKSKWYLPWALGAAYGLTTPIAVAAGLGVRSSLAPNSQNTRIVNGVFDSISAGILIYTGLVELMAHDFMFNPEMRKASMKMLLLAYLCMCIGAGLMALLGKWA